MPSPALPAERSQPPAPSAPTRVSAALRAGRWLPVLVLVIGWAFSAWMYVLLRSNAEQRERVYFAERVAEAEAAIRVRISHYVDALLGGSSFYAALPQLDRNSWRLYTDSLQMRRRYPGINGLGVILVVPPERVAEWKARMRTLDGKEPEIRPFPGTQARSDDEVKYLISFVEGNMPDRGPIGRDIASDPSRRAAAERARDTGEPQLNHRILGSRDTQRRAGLLLYVPLYAAGQPLETVEQRRAAVVGWVYAQLFPDVFLEGVLGPMGQVMRLHFFEEGELVAERLLYSSGLEQVGSERRLVPSTSGAMVPRAASARTEEGRPKVNQPGQEPLPTFEQVTRLNLAGREFQLGWRRGPQFRHADRSPARWVAGSLAVATLFLAGLIASLQSTGRRAQLLADARTADLAASEERFRQAFESAGVGMALTTLDGRFVRVNPLMSDIVGYAESTLLQKRCQEITHPEDLAADLSLRGELIEGRRRVYELEKRYLHRDGHAVWVRLTSSLIRDAAGGPQMIIAQVEDITERKRLEQTIAAARDEALAASRHKSAFLSSMVEEFRAPLQDFASLTRLLRGTTLTAVQEEHLRALEAAGEASLTVANDILEYSRIEAGEIEMKPEVFALRGCVEEVIALFAERARRRNVRLEATIAARVPFQAEADRRRLRQILVNLVHHAFTQTVTGEVRVSLTAEALDAASGRQRLKFAVRDTGPGMAPERLEMLFKSFSSVDASTRRAGGTTLGLAISKRLAELMGGTMWAQSEPGRGSTFHFTVLVQPKE